MRRTLVTVISGLAALFLISVIVMTIKGGRVASVQTQPDGGEPCRSYDAARLHVADAGDRGWIVGDGEGLEILADTEGDAKRMMAVASAYSQLCALPRVRAGYVRYFKGSTLTTAPVIPGLDDCLAYDPQLLAIQNTGRSYRVAAGNHLLFGIVTEADARTMLELLRHYHETCFVGRSNRRTNRDRYIVMYWR
jgi:hypothetical protein